MFCQAEWARSKEQLTSQLHQKETEIQEKAVQIYQRDASLRQARTELQEKEVQIQQREAELRQARTQLQQKDIELSRIQQSCEVPTFIVVA